MAEISVALRLSSMRMPLKRALAAASQMGARQLELDARGEIHPEAISGTGLRHFRKMLTDLNLSVVALRFQTRRGYDVAQDLERRVEATKSAMRLAYELGVTSVINQVGRVPDDVESPEFASFQSVMDDLGKHGARVGAFLAAETGTESGPKLEQLLRGSEDGFVAAALNPGYLIINRFDVHEAIKSLGSRIQVVCATDGVLDLAAGRGVSVAIGQGTADFPQIIGMLEDYQFRGPYIVGRGDSSAEELSQGLQYFQNL